VGVLRAEVQRRDGRPLSPAGAHSRAFEARADRTGEHVHEWVLRRCIQQSLQPSWARPNVIVDEHHQLAAGAFNAGVASRVQPERLRVGHVLRTEATRQRMGGKLGPRVVDDENLHLRIGGLGSDRGESDLEVGEPGACGDDDRG
jgi:hypothetical protein